MAEYGRLLLRIPRHMICSWCEGFICGGMTVKATKQYVAGEFSEAGLPISRNCLSLTMANSKGPSNFRNMMYNGKHSLLPPKSPFPSMSPSYLDHVSGAAIEVKGIPKPREGNPHHQRTSSESTLIEDQPSWLDKLLNEPETPLRKGHRRSSSDSFVYMDVANATKIDYAAQDDYRSRNIAFVPSQGYVKTLIIAKMHIMLLSIQMCTLWENSRTGHGIYLQIH